jgi:hypothetical protein
LLDSSFLARAASVSNLRSEGAFSSRAAVEGRGLDEGFEVNVVPLPEE